MNIIQSIYVLSAVASIACMLPQIKQLLQTKNSDEFNVSTWFVWAIGQVCGLVYSISIGAFAFLLVSIAWIAFYSLMVGLILHYRYKPKLVPQEVSEPSFTTALDVSHAQQHKL